VQALGLGERGAGFVVLQAQGGFEGGDELGLMPRQGNAPVEISSQRPASWRPAASQPLA